MMFKPFQPFNRIAPFNPLLSWNALFRYAKRDIVCGWYSSGALVTTNSGSMP